MSDTSPEKSHSKDAAVRIAHPSPQDFALLQQRLQECEQEKLELENENASYLTAITRLNKAAKKPAAQSVAFDSSGYEAKIKELENQLHTAESSRQDTPAEEELRKFFESREENFQAVAAEQDDVIAGLQAENAELSHRIQELEERDRLLRNSLLSAYNDVEDLKAKVKKSNRSTRAVEKELGRIRSEYGNLHDIAVGGWEYHNELVANLATVESLDLESLGPRESSNLGRLDNSDQVSDSLPFPQLPSVRTETPLQESLTETGSQVGWPSEDIKSEDPEYEGTPQPETSFQEDVKETGSGEEPSEVSGNQDQQVVGTSPPVRSRPSSPPTGTQNQEEAGADTQVGPLRDSSRDLGLQDQPSVGAAQPAPSRPSSISRASGGTPELDLREHVPQIDEPTGPPSPSLGSPSPVGLGLSAGCLTARHNRRGKSWAESSSEHEEAVRKTKSVAPSALSTSILQVEPQQPKTEEEARAPGFLQFQAEEQIKFKTGKEVKEPSTVAKIVGETEETEDKKVEQTYSTKLTGPKPQKQRVLRPVDKSILAAQKQIDDIHAAEIRKAMPPSDWETLFKMTKEDFEAMQIADEKNRVEENRSLRPANGSSMPQASKPKSTVNQTGYQKAVSEPPPPPNASVQAPSAGGSLVLRHPAAKSGKTATQPSAAQATETTQSTEASETTARQSTEETQPPKPKEPADFLKAFEGLPSGRVYKKEDLGESGK
ncbi:hypothetical protein G7Y79_00033g068530 [Physcia stellaris]|nr:hypothetical protein G7Y79_00033g068530 [Physcia stellaris]